MSIDYIRKQLESDKLDFGAHLVDRMLQYHIDLDQIIQVIKEGKINKKLPDERSGGKFTKYTLTRGTISVVIKDSDIPFVITVYRR